MKKRYKLYGGYLPLFVIALISTSVLRTIALLNDFDKRTGYFTSKTLITVADYILIGAAILLFTYIFTSKGGLKLIPDFTSPATYAPTGIVGAALVFVGIHFFSAAGDSADRIRALKEYGTHSAESLIANERILLILSILIGALALLSAVHFALCALIERSMSFGRADFGIVTVAFLAVYVIYLYFNNDQPINSPGKILDQITLLFAAVFFLYETRLSIGREKWRAYIAFGFIAALLSAYSAIPSLIYYFARGTEVTGSVYEMILTASLCVFITARLFITGDLIPDTVSPFATIFKMASEARSEEIAPAIKEEETPEPEEISAIDENQLTIDDALRAEEAAEDTVTDGQIPLEIALAVGTDGEIAAEIEDAAKAEGDSDTDAEEKVNAADSGNDEGIDATASEENTSVSSTKKTEEESADESDAPDNN